MSLAIKRTEHGLGLFATRPYDKGEYIIEYFGKLLPAEEADRSRSRYIFALTSKWAIDGTDRANVARYINHSCKPNVYAVGSKRLWIHAARRIKAGEQLTLDYGEEYTRAFIPVCKCDHCNGTPRGKARANGARKTG
ncbi:MAG: SET domain-containing protein [Gemmatimonas sp.]